MIAPFSESNLNSIFIKSSKNPQLIKTNEGIFIEYKESFGWVSLPEYLRTMAAYANRDGGYIIFGIKNRPHTLAGLSNDALVRFNEIDKARWSTHLREHFSPEIIWDRTTHIFDSKTFGIVYTYPAESKPVICKKDYSGELQKASIYYRYNSQSTKIEFSELLAIIEKEKQKISDLWLQRIKQIESAGIASSAILDLDTGKVNGTYSSLYIDENLLEQISFINDGTFVESGGEPTLKVIGNVQTVDVGPPVIIETGHELGINYDLIISKFLNQEEIISPEEYIKQLCYQTASTLPIYYYMSKAALGLEETKQLINRVEITSKTKQSLLNRISNDNSFQQHIPIFDNHSSRLKMEIRSKLISEEMFFPSDVQELKFLLSSIRILTKEEISEHLVFILDTVKSIYTQWYHSVDTNIRALIRQAICWVDEALYKTD